jgi:hypothetical protein
MSAVAIEYFQRSNLADPIPLVLTAIGAFAGAPFGYWVATGIYKERPERWAIIQNFMIFFWTIGGLLLGTLMVRTIFLHIAFAGLATDPSPGTIEVVSRGSGCSRDEEGRCRYNVALQGGEREFRVLVTRELHDKIGPNPHENTHCLKLGVETGRFGIRRVFAPNYTDKPIGMDRYSLC